MSDAKIYDVPADWASKAYLDDAKYQAMYAASVEDPEAFWGEHGKRIHWMTPYKRVKNVSFAPGNVSIKWFEDGTTNAAYNCIDRHLPARRHQPQDRTHQGDPAENRREDTGAAASGLAPGAGEGAAQSRQHPRH